jgi:polysaccharide export outer membrane protein
LAELLVLGAGAALSGCASSTDNSKVQLAPPTERTVLEPGDTFELQIVGESGLPQHYTVFPDGTVDLPYVPGVKAAGLEPQELSRLYRQRLIEAGILTEPSVVISVTEYKSKHITLLGQVQKPGSYTFSPGLTLIQAVSLAGGLTAIANADRINISRKSVEGTRTVVVSIEAIYEGRSADIPLQAGDQIYVNERLF